MKKKELELLEEYLWKLTKAIGHNTPGLPEDWMHHRVAELADIFRPEIKTPHK